MSTLVENVEKVKNAHAALKIAIESKGVAVPAGTKLTGMPALVDQIQTGGGGGGGEDYGYLTFTAVYTTTLTLMQSGGLEPLKLLKSTDAVTWTKWENPSTNGISLNAGEHVYLKADEDALWRTGRNGAKFNSFNSTDLINCSGDIRSIIKANVPADYSFWLCSLFNSCNLKTAPELPSTTLVERCYSTVFINCLYLTQAPELPATTLAINCYDNMFYGCTSLTQAPALPATTLDYGCYQEMFSGCTSLTRIKMNASSGNWGSNMFNGCTSLELVDMTGSTGVPQLEDVNNFEGTNDTYKIVVPDSLYDTWIAETNWASIADHIMKQSDWNNEHPDDQL